MKKWLIVMMTLCMLLCSLTVGAEKVQFFYDGAYHDYEGNLFKLKVNGNLLTPAIPPIVFSDYSVVPARAVFQDGLGAKVAWDGTKQKVTVTMGETELEMYINKTKATLNGKTVTMPIAPKIINDYTMIPARFVGEELGMKVEFDTTTDTISITEEEREIVTVSKVLYEQESETDVLLTIMTDTKNPEYDAFLLKEPTRLVVDVLDGVYTKIPEVILFASGNLQKIRFGQQPTTARVAFDLTEDLGYEVWSRGKNIYISITIDPTLNPPITDVFKEVTYGYEGGRDYIKFKLDMGKPVRKGSKIMIPISGENLPDEPAEKNVTGFFGKKMLYTPGEDETSGTITVELKNTDFEMYVQGNEVRMKSIHKALPRSVTLDAGHGGMDGGAVAYEEDGVTILAKEKDFNLDIALRAQELLEADDIEVHMIRDEDVYVDYLRVGSIANDAGTSLFVSIHTNSTITDVANGIETYGYLEAGSVSNGMTSERLSEIMLESLLDETGAHDRGVKDGKTLAVINSTQMPATLVEIGFISNPEECAKLMTEEYRQKLAQAIYNGVIAAFEEMEI
ncbi:MAG: N-acetylmuramoyl-L-alanine amidase [Clostridia bacterium]|nr:N-acetylmuramoyl-L-alanine amidase [Clostridia bacterium]